MVRSKNDASDRSFEITFVGLADSSHLEFPLEIDGKLFPFHRGEQVLWRSKDSNRVTKLQVVNNLFDQLRSISAFHASLRYSRRVLRPDDPDMLIKYQVI